MGKKQIKMTRRQVLKAGLIGGVGLMLPLRFFPAKVFASPALSGLSDPAWQHLFETEVPDALNPGFKYTPMGSRYVVGAGPATQQTGLRDGSGTLLDTPVWGYGQIVGRSVDATGYTWPGRTFEVQAGRRTTVNWQNNLPVGPHLLPVDTTLHWCYSLQGYTGYSIDANGVPIVMHLHGGHNKDLFDGNPEQFFGPGYFPRGPRFQSPLFIYDNDRPAGNLWYHDHGLGITRLNVYAGLAGFYFVRDDQDTGLPDNPLGLPAWPYEKAYAIQDRMFRDTGELFYPAFQQDNPPWGEFIDGAIELAMIDSGLFGDPLPVTPGLGPSALAEFFGDHMVVNGTIWPKENVRPRQYRLHILNGTDSRFLAIRFRVVPRGNTDFSNSMGTVPFHVVGSDQGLVETPTDISGRGYLVSEPGSRYDIVIDFSGLENKRIIMENLGGDEPFGGDIPGNFVFQFTDRIMAFDVGTRAGEGDLTPYPPDVWGGTGPDVGTPSRVRKVALFEGTDEFGRLQPLLGTAEPATDFMGMPINWPNTQPYIDAGLTGQMEGSIAWHSPTTENPALNTTEEWEVWNLTGDAHPIHLHLVHFDIIGRQEINFDDNADDDGFIPAGMSPADDGIYLVPQPVVQHNGEFGSGYRIVHPSDAADAYGAVVSQPDGYVEDAPKDMVIALPGQITRIKATFDKPGRYVWHCHILSHEDHEMMRVLHVGGGAMNAHP